LKQKSDDQPSWTRDWSSLPEFAKAGLEAAHGEGAGARGVAEAGEVEDAVKYVGQKFVA